jgi:uncharacterized protein
MNLLLLILAIVGHGYLLMIGLNLVYSRPYSRVLLRTLRKVCGLLLVVGPVAIVWFLGLDAMRLLETRTVSPVSVASAIFVCFGLLCIFNTCQYHFRPRPRGLLSEESQTIDIAYELGGRPVGDGKHRSLAAKSWNDLFRVEFTKLELAPQGLPPAWDGLTILHLSDLHFYGTPAIEYYDAVLWHAMADGPPDLVVISGDIIDDERYVEWIRPVLSKLSWTIGAVAILGNHDWWFDDQPIRGAMASLGIAVLGNGVHTLDVRGLPLVAIGHEGPWFRPAPDPTTWPDGFRLLVSHTPDNLGWAKRNGISLMLSGHNHGGQIRLPLFGSMFVPSRYSRKYDMGTFEEGPTMLHVNRGLSGKEPIRLRCRPQVTRITLRAPANLSGVVSTVPTVGS